MQYLCKTNRPGNSQFHRFKTKSQIRKQVKKDPSLHVQENKEIEKYLTYLPVVHISKVTQ
jgi:hypothetical protein